MTSVRLPAYYLSHGGGPWPYMKVELGGQSDRLEASIKDILRQLGESQPILHWFHVAMRMTQLTQLIKGLPTESPETKESCIPVEEHLRVLRRARAYLWHGSPHRGLHELEDLTWDIGTESERAQAVQDKLEEFMNYVTANLHAIPNYADPHRPTGFCRFARPQPAASK